MSITLKAAKREIVGKKSKKLRREAIVPGNLQGRKIENVNIQIDEKDLQVAIKAAGAGAGAGAGASSSVDVTFF